MTRTETLTSAANPLLKDVRRAIARGARTQDGYCIAETFHLLEEALRSECEIQVVLAAASVRPTVETHVRRLAGVRVAVLDDRLFATISGTESAQGVMALVRPPEWSLDQLFRARPLLLVVDGVQDPGNAGAMIRAAEAFGATGVMFLKGSASPYNPKAVRASAGSVFRVPMAVGLDAALARAALEQRRVNVYAATPRGELDLGAADLVKSCALIIGGEGRGVSQRLLSAAMDLRIPVAGVESLNAAMAAGVLLYEARRQRSK